MFDYEMMKVKMKVNVIEGKRVSDTEGWDRGIDCGRDTTDKPGGDEVIQ